MLLGSVVLLMLAHTNAFVTELTDDTFYSYAKDKDILLVDFFAPWCSDCTKLAPEFEGAGTSLGPRSLDLAKVDCFGAGKGLCEMYGVKSWPQLKNFNRGTYTGDYTGLQTADAIASYVNTVENSAVALNGGNQPQLGMNPYAMAFPAQPQQPFVQPNVQSNKSPVGAVSPPANSITCAKCNIEKPDKTNTNCSESLKKACITRREKKINGAEKKKYADDDKRSQIQAR